MAPWMCLFPTERPLLIIDDIIDCDWSSPGFDFFNNHCVCAAFTVARTHKMESKSHLLLVARS